MKNLWAVMFAAMMVVLTSCDKDKVTGNGDIITEARGISNFTMISTNGASDVTVTKGPAFKVQVKGYHNLLPYFETKVFNGTLQLGYKGNVNVRRDNIEVLVTMPACTGLIVNGSGDITTSGNFDNNDAFQAEISGSGNILIQDGDAKDFSSSISGSGRVEAFGFTARKANIHISGSGNTNITATDELNVRISGSGKVYYKGSPNTSISISGSGSVSKQ